MVKKLDFTKPLTIVCLGDSITCDWDKPSYVNFWQDLLQKRFNNSKIKVINAGVSGDTVQDGYYRLQKDVLSYKPNLVTIMFGHNAVMFGLSPMFYWKYLESITDLLKRQSKAEVWLLTPNRVGDENKEKKYFPYLQKIRESASQSEARVVDVWGTFAKASLEEIYTFKFDYGGLSGKDYIHPNQKGQRLIAKALMEFVEKYD